MLAYSLVGLAEGASRRLVQKGLDFDPDQVAAKRVEIKKTNGLATGDRGRTDQCLFS